MINEEKSEKGVIYYFSGTGNSLELARGIKKLCPEYMLVPIINMINTNNYRCSAENIGFVFPCHGFTAPSPVKRFIDNFIPEKAQYIFSAVTRGGTSFIGFDGINKALFKHRKRLDATFVLDMPGNDPKFKEFKNPDDREIAEYNSKLKVMLDSITSVIRNKETFHSDTAGETIFNNKVFEKIIEKLVSFSVQKIAPGTKRYFYIDGKCNGCGICEKVCTSGKIQMDGKRPVWRKGKDCYMCYACINFCPKETIQIYSKYYMKSYTEKTGRYSHPYVTYKDIMKQKTGEVDEEISC